MEYLVGAGYQNMYFFWYWYMIVFFLLADPEYLLQIGFFVC
jgi:hypothetical protein